MYTSKEDTELTGRSIANTCMTIQHYFARLYNAIYNTE